MLLRLQLISMVRLRWLLEDEAASTTLTQLPDDLCFHFDVVWVISTLTAPLARWTLSRHSCL